MHEASRRFKIVDKPTALPGCCFSCRAENRPWFIDLGISFEFHGAAFLCSHCFSEIAGLVGFMHVDEAMGLEKYVEEIRSFNVDLVTESLENVTRSVSDSLSMLSGVRDYLNTPAPVASEDDGDEPSSDIGTDVSPHAGEEGSSEQGSEQGLDDLRSGDRSDKPNTFDFG